jgi:hypothetical protein
MKPSKKPKRMGRPPGSGGPILAPEDATKPRSVRLNDSRWAKYKRLGRDWLERAIDGAMDPGGNKR